MKDFYIHIYQMQFLNRGKKLSVVKENIDKLVSQDHLIKNTTCIFSIY